MKKNSFETILYSTAGVVILLVIIIAFNALTGTVKQRIDLTQEKAYTLSAGTKAILAKLDTPVKIRFYYSSSDASGDTVMLRNYAQHVSDLLDEYKQAAHGKIILEQYDPEPDSDAEDSARLDGVEGQMLRSGEKFYMGLSVSMLDSKQAIPFLDPGRERLLEYDLSRAISRVVTPDKPVVGVMSPLPVFGHPSNPMLARMGQGGQGQNPWVFITELKGDYNVKQIEMNASKIDDDVKVLVVIHPKDISDTAQYAIDQFIMRGGKLIAFLDATSLVDSHNENPMMGSMPGGGSSLDKLLKAWGIQFENTKVVADMNYKVKLMGRDNQPTEAPTFLDITKDGLNKDDVATSEINDVFYPFGGVFTGTPVSGLKETVLIKSSKDSQLVDGMMASFSGDNIMKQFKPSGTEYALAVRLSGKFKTAFPEGKPKDTSDKDAKDSAKDSSKSTGETLKESKGDTAVVLVGDADMLYDEFAVRQQPGFLGIGGMLIPINGDLELAQNLVDQLGGDNNLISIRSRADMNRPFTRIKAMEAKAQESEQSKIEAFQQSLQDTQQKLNELQAKKGDGQQRFILSPEQQAELEKLKKKQAEVKAQLRQEQKRLTHDIYALENTLKWTNIIAMPAVVALSGIGLAMVKRKRTSAK
ncbi:MAG TPA: Gldg family protein [Verrucomicrobiae bacterium]|nr:Gldg family protein [Verrucomicrobiae bacterium]